VAVSCPALGRWFDPALCQARILERGKTSGRTDDNSESLKKRYDTYQNETRPVLDYFARTPGLVKQIDSSVRRTPLAP
jgi:UMP-CMP kinase